MVDDSGAGSRSYAEGLVVERAGARLTITLDRPERRNALTSAMIVMMADALDDAALDDDVRVVVIRANGSDFCAGIDLTASNAPRPGGRPRTGHLQRGFQLGAHRLMRTIQEVQLPVVTVVQGHAAGIGNALALSGDTVIATTDARFWAPFVERGFTPDSGTTYLLPRLIGMARAKEMVLRGRVVDGETAERWGMIARAVPPERLDGAAEDVVAGYESAATIAVGLAKSLLHRNVDAEHADALANEGMYEELAVRSADFKEGVTAFAEKRSPRYRGR